MTDDDAMRTAIRKAREGIAAGQSPFGAAIVRDGKIIAEAHNTVWLDCNPTAHAEINALRAAAQAIGAIDLSGSTVYSTCEPCPMCLAAIHWSKADRVVFGASIGDAHAAGFAELPIPAAQMVALGHSPLRVEGGRLAPECAALFDEWKKAGLSAAY
jgi:tRNA(Arg) A34 adenosine deaminase TadA